MHAICNMLQPMASTKTLIRAITSKVTRKYPELLTPSQPTPREFKFLSDIDDQHGLRFRIPIINFYRRNPSMEGKDPVKIIRDAIAKALVFYYPMAGRLREIPGRKLVVECTGEGVVFVEADADVTLQQFGEALYPPFPHVEKLLPDIPGSDGIINSPILITQVTRLKCGGFIFANRFNHTMCDGAGILQFISAVGDLARGGAVPSTAPVWQRHILSARQPPHVSFTHPEYDVLTNPKEEEDKMVHRSFSFAAADISALRRSLSPPLRSCSEFEVVVACVWRCRTLAVSRKPDEETRFLCVMDMRKRMNPPLPSGYYGNAIVFPAAITTAEKLSSNPLDYAVELVREAKQKAEDEYVRSVADLMVVRDRPSFTAAMTYMVSNVRHLRYEEVDFGWGTAAYGGVAKGFDFIPTPVSWYRGFKNKMGEEEGIVVAECLPLDAMEEFAKQLQMMMTTARTSSEFNLSKL